MLEVPHRSCTYAPCPGSRVQGYQACFGHLQELERAVVLEAALAANPGVIDVLRKSTVPWEVLELVLSRCSEDGFVTRQFDARGATFDKTVALRGLRFRHRVLLSGLTGRQGCDFSKSTFEAGLTLQGSVIEQSITFRDTTVHGELDLTGARIDENLTIRRSPMRDLLGARLVVTGSTTISGSTIKQSANFRHASFGKRVVFADCTLGRVSFNHATFSDSLQIVGTQAKASVSLAGASVGRLELSKFAIRGAFALDAVNVSESAAVNVVSDKNISLSDSSWPLVRLTLKTRHSVILHRAIFSRPAQLDAEWARVSAVDARFQEGFAATLRGGSLDLRGARITGPTSVHGLESPRLVGLKRAHLQSSSFMHLDLSRVRLSGASGLDQLRWSDELTLWRTPSLWARLHHLVRLALHEEPAAPKPHERGNRRITIADEWDWRQGRRWRVGWGLPERLRDPGSRPTAEQVSRLYRDLRKGREAVGDHGGAGDYYYGEMEMRRLGSRLLSVERSVLSAYRVLSGYGLKVARPLVAVLIIWVLLGLGFYMVGFQNPAAPHSPARGSNTAATAACWPISSGTAACQPVLSGLQYAAESLVSLPGAAPLLTGWGRLLRLLARVAGPVLLALLALAVRNRVRR